MNNGSKNNGRTPKTSGQGIKFATNVSHNSTALVAILNRAFSRKCNFTILSQTVDRQSSPELMKIKEQVKKLPEIEFQTLSGFSEQIHDNNSKLQNYRRETFLNRAFILNEPEFKRLEEAERVHSWIVEAKNHLGTSGGESIDRHMREIIECALWVEEEANKIKLKIRAIYILRENTEYWQGFWDAIKDKVALGIPSAGPEPVKTLLGLVNWVAELVASGIVYNQSWEREKFMEVLDTWEDMLTRDQNLILATKEEMSDYMKFTKKAQGLWALEVDSVWDMTRKNLNSRAAIVQYDTCLQVLEMAEGMLSLTIKPFEQALIQIHPYYGPGISVERNTKDFCEHVPYVSIYLKSLLTAKGIIADGQEEQFEEKVYCLARIIYGRLQTIKELCAQWSKSIDPGELETFIKKGNLDFIRGTDRVIQAIESMLQTETQNSKEMEALKKRTEWDRRYKSWNWNDRPLVTSASACSVLKDLEAIIEVIYGLSLTTGTGTNMLSIANGRPAEVRRSNVEFNHSNPLLKEFFEVLGAEIQRGSIEFPEKKEKQMPVTETKKARGGGLFKRQWKKWWGVKPVAPSPMEELGLI